MKTKTTALKQPAPTPTAEELARQVEAIVLGDFGDPEAGDTIAKISTIIQSALTQAKAETRREAADDLCASCQGRDICHEGKSLDGKGGNDGSAEKVV